MLNNKSEIGFSRSVDDYRKKDFDLNSLIMPNKNASFILTMSSNKFSNYGIYEGDNLIVDKTLAIGRHNLSSFVVIEREGLMQLTTARHLFKRAKFAKEEFNYRQNAEIVVWGCVRSLVRKMPY